MRRKLLLIIVAIPVLLVLCAVLYLKFADLGGYRTTVENAVSDALGRRLTIAGKFEPHVSLDTRLVAERVTLSHPGWAGDTEMVYVERLAGSINLWSLVSGPIRVSDVEIEGARVQVAVDANGRSNWDFDFGDSGKKKKQKSDTPPAQPVVFDNVTLEQVELRIVPADPQHELVLNVASLEARPVENELLDLEIEGTFEDAPFDLSGRIGPRGRLLLGREMTHDLSGHFADAEFALRGSLAEWVKLRGVDLDAEAQGPDIAEITGRFGLPVPLQGPFRVSARTASVPRGAEVDLDVSIDALTARANGTVGSLLSPQEMDAEVLASGPDLAVIGALLGVEGLPPETFSVTGRLMRNSSRTAFREVTARAGDNELKLDGVLGSLPRLLGTDFTFEASGPDLSTFGSLAGVKLPPRDFDASGRLVRVEDGVRSDGVRARVGNTVLELRGTVGDRPKFESTDVSLHLEGPDLSEYERLAGLELPALPFRVEGGVAYRDPGLALDAIEAHLGNDTLHVDGTIDSLTKLEGARVTVNATGPDLSWVGKLFSFPSLPAEPYDIRGELRVRGEGYELRSVEASVGKIEVAGAGLITSRSGLTGSDLRLHATGPDASRVFSVAGLQGLPREPFEVEGRLRLSADRYELEAVEARLGRLELKADGHVAATEGLAGSDIAIDARGPDLSALGAYSKELPTLPATSFAIAGRLGIERNTYRLQEIEGELDLNRFKLDGAIAAEPFDYDLTVEASGPDLAAVGTLLAEVDVSGIPELPAESYAVSGRVRFENDEYDLRDVTVRLADAELSLQGTLGSPPRFVGAQLTFDAHGSDASVPAAIAGVSLPAEAFDLRGTVSRREAGFRFDELVANLGQYRARVNGTLGEWPKLAGTRLDVRARGPSLDLFREFVEIPRWPEEPFEVAGHVEGTPEQFSVEDFSVRVGSSDLSGSVRIDLRDKPDLEGELRSNRIDLTPLLGLAREEAVEEQKQRSGAAPEAAAASKRKKGKWMISDDPLELDGLREANGHVLWTADEIVTLKESLRNFVLDLQLRDGRLQVDRLSLETRRGGRLAGGLSLDAVGEDLHVRAQLSLNNGRLGMLSPGIEPDKWPTIEIGLEFDGVGRSPHAIVSGADGRLVVGVSQGEIDSSVVDIIAADVLIKLLDTLNPFREEAPRSELECAVIAVDLVDGRAKVQPIAIRGDKMTTVGNGRIDFGTERLDLEWAVKPRKGLGISVSTVTNRYVKLGGTLSKPAIEFKPLDAVVTTGAAVATMGLSLVARGLYDRVTAEQKACAQATKEIKRQDKKRAADEEKRKSE